MNFFPMKSQAQAWQRHEEQATHRRHRVVFTTHSTLEEYLAGEKHFGYTVMLDASGKRPERRPGRSLEIGT